MAKMTQRIENPETCIDGELFPVILFLPDSYDFLEALSTEQELLNGIGTDKVNPYIEESIFQKRPLVHVLRLLCLQCLTNNGFKPKLYEYYKKEIIQVSAFFVPLCLYSV